MWEGHENTVLVWYCDMDAVHVEEQKLSIPSSRIVIVTAGVAIKQSLRKTVPSPHNETGTVAQIAKMILHQRLG